MNDIDTATPQQRFSYPANLVIEKLVKGLLSPDVDLRLILKDAMAIFELAARQGAPSDINDLIGLSDLAGTIELDRLNDLDRSRDLVIASGSSEPQLKIFDRDDSDSEADDEIKPLLDTSVKGHKTEQRYEAIHEQLKLIHGHIQSLRNRDHNDAADKLQAMHQAIKTELASGEDADLSTCLNQVNQTKSDLSSYKKIQFILTNLAVAICSIFLGYAIALLWQNTHNKPLGFFRPKTKELTNDLLATIKAASPVAA